jgi:hypothetical protein
VLTERHDGYAEPRGLWSEQRTSRFDGEFFRKSPSTWWNCSVVAEPHTVHWWPPPSRILMADDLPARWLASFSPLEPVGRRTDCP